MTQEKEYTCTEITVDVDVPFYNVRLWIGTDGLADEQLFNAIRQQVVDLVNEYERLATISDDYCDATPQDVLLYFKENIPFINAVQVRESHTVPTFGVMAYTTAFEDNDAERFRQ